MTNKEKKITVNLIAPDDSHQSKGILYVDKPDTPIFAFITIILLYIIIFSIIGGILNMPYVMSVKIIILIPIIAVLILLSVITYLYIKKQNTMIAYYNSLKNKHQESGNS